MDDPLGGAVEQAGGRNSRLHTQASSEFTLLQNHLNGSGLLVQH